MLESLRKKLEAAKPKLQSLRATAQAKVKAHPKQAAVAGGVVLAAVVGGVTYLGQHKATKQVTPMSGTGFTAMAATTNPAKVGMFTSSDGTGNPGTWLAMQGTGTPFTGTVQPIGLSVSVDGTGNPGTWAAATPATFASGAVPSWMNYFGDGSEGDFNCTSQCNIASGEHWYRSFTEGSSGGGFAYVFANGNNLGAAYQYLILRVQGACTMWPNAYLSQSAYNFANGTTSGGWSGSGGGGGGGTAAGTAGTNGSFTTVPGGSGGPASGGSAGSGTSVPASAIKAFLSGYGWLNATGGTGIGGMPGGAGGSGGGAGGVGGGVIIMICGSLNLMSGSVIDAGGHAGANAAANNTGPGGGGGGGIVIIRSPQVVANAISISVNGGNGGSCGSFTGCGSSGAGGTGWSYIFQN